VLIQAKNYSRDTPRKQKVTAFFKTCEEIARLRTTTGHTYFDKVVGFLIVSEFLSSTTAQWIEQTEIPNNLSYYKLERAIPNLLPGSWQSSETEEDIFKIVEAACKKSNAQKATRQKEYQPDSS